MTYMQHQRMGGRQREKETEDRINQYFYRKGSLYISQKVTQIIFMCKLIPNFSTLKAGSTRQFRKATHMFKIYC